MYGDTQARGFRTLLMAALAIIMPPSVQAAEGSPLHDIVIRNGKVLDGAGNPWMNADIAINDGLLVKIGRVEGRGQREIDAGGKYVSPGWIDMMDQSGRVLRVNGLAENKLLMGVTTIFSGEAGTPVAADKIADYLDSLVAQGISPNFGTYYGAYQARVDVMGSGAGTPDAAQMAAMKDRVDIAMRQGALGLTTALIYPPSSFQGTAELVELMKVAAAYDGIYATHIRNESANLLEGVSEAIEIGEKAGAQVEIYHLKGAYQPGWGKLLPKAGEIIQQARDRGVDVAADVYPYVAAGTGLDATIPTWVFDQGLETAVERLKDPEIRTKLKSEVAGGSRQDWSNLVEASGGWEGVVLAQAFSPAYQRYETMSLAAIASELGKDPADVAWDIVLAAQPNRAVALFYMIGERDVERALQYPWTSIGSDAAAAAAPGQIDDLGLPHPRSYGTFPRVIAEYVVNRKTLTLEDAIRKMTSWPANRMRLHDRGLLREGMRADITIFDLDRLKDMATFAEPTAYPTGIDYVVVNGVLVVDEGRHTGATPGQIIRGSGVKAATGR